LPNAPGASWFLSSKGCGRGRRKRGGSVRQPPPRNETAPCNAPGGANRAEPSVDDDNAEKLAGRPGPAAQEGQFDGVRESAQSWKEAPNPAVRISGGGCLIVGSPLQQQNGIHDTPDLAFKDWIEWGGPSADAVWARYYIEHTLHDLYHWAERLGVRWVDLKAQEGNSVLRWTRPERNGLGLMIHLIESFRKKGGEIIPETEITALRLEGGRVTGLEGCDAKTGEPIAVRRPKERSDLSTGLGPLRIFRGRNSLWAPRPPSFPPKKEGGFY